MLGIDVSRTVLEAVAIKAIAERQDARARYRSGPACRADAPQGDGVALAVGRFEFADGPRGIDNPIEPGAPHGKMEGEGRAGFEAPEGGVNVSHLTGPRLEIHLIGHGRPLRRLRRRPGQGRKQGPTPC